ncbi:hypothetical protein GCM10009112_02170 [Marinomonas arenicola]|uniref:Ig-like domain-containing protein n=1 Tax=Marinomonas arenicola TaxID=569601 RepID=UPI0031D8E036
MVDTQIGDLTSDITDETNSGSNDDTITNDTTPAISGVTEAGASVTITYTDASGTEYTTDAVTADADGNYTIAIESALAEGPNTLSIKAVDVAGNESTTTQDVTVDTLIDAPVITNITDDSANSDYSTVTLHGTGEPGTSITLHVISGSSSNGNNTQTGEYVEVEGLSIVVDENGNWTADVSNLTDVQANDNEFFKATQTDAAGNVSADSNTAHYWHGTSAAVATEVGDDYVLSGSGNDQITITGDDTNDGLTIDGGAGVDTVIFQNFDASQATFVVDDNGNLQITRGDTGDVVLLIDVENVKIDGMTYTIDELFTPTVAITNDTNNDGLLNSGEADGSVTVSIDLPIGAKVGDTINVTSNNGEADQVITLNSDDIANGSVFVSDIAVTEGETLEVSASLSTGGGVGTDSALVDTSVSTLTSDITDATNSGSNDDSITNNATPTIAGQTEAGATVTITYTDASGTEQTTDAVTADADGNYSITIPAALDEGSNDLTVKAVDVAGNETTITQNVTVDTSVSSLTADITDATNSGSNDDSITNNATPTIAGQTEAGATVTITYTDASGTEQTTDAVTADTDGNYSITIPAALDEGSNDLTVKAVDVAGNETKIMQDVTIDNSVGSPAISIAGDTNEDGVYNAEELGENGTVTATVSLPDDFDSETDTLTINGETYSLSAGEIAAGEVTVELEPEATIKATITDAAGNTSSEATATALAANEAPVAEAKNDSVDEDSRITGSITANDADLPSTANLTFSTTAIVAGLMLNSNGTYAFDASSYDSLKDGEELELEIPITVTDDKGATDTTTLTITVTGTNDVPTATAKVDSVTENHTITGTISANDVDLADGAALSFSTTSDVAGLTLKSDGSYSFDASSYDSLAAGEKQLVEVPVTVTDDKGATTETTLTITVTGTNDAPVATDDSTMTYDTGIRLDELPEYGTMQVQNTDGNWVEMTVGVTYGSDSEVRFIPDDNIDDSIEFTVGSIDSNPSTSSFDGTASVSDWGDLVDGKAVKSFDSNEDGTPELTVTTSVSSGDLTAVNGKSHQGHGIGNDNHSGLSGDEFLRVDIDSSNIAINKISFTLDGLGGYFDGGHSNSTKVSITAYTSDGEEISTDGGYRQNGNYEETYTFITDQAVDYFVLTTTGGTGTYVVQNMTVSQAVSDEVTLTTLQADGSETTTGVIFDPSDVSEDGTVSLTSKFADLLDSDLTEGAIATDEDASITIDVLANDTDVDGTIDPTSVVITTQPEHGTVSVNSETGKVTYTPNEHYNGNDSFEYTVEDNNGLVSNPATVSLTVNSVDDAPVITLNDESVTVSEKGLEDSTTGITSSTGTFTVSDADGDDLSVSLAAPTETYTSGGVALVWALTDSGDLIGSANGDDIVTVTLGDVNSSGEGSYTVTLNGPVDQPNTTADDSLSIQFGVAVNDGTSTTTSMVTAVIEDDAPTSVTTEAELLLSASTFSISKIASGFSDVVFTDGHNRIGTSNAESTDLDTYDEKVSWGNSVGDLNNVQVFGAGESSLDATEVVDFSSNISFDDSVVVANITHKNDGLIGSYGSQTIADSFDSAYFNVDVTMMIDGEEKTVSLSSLFTENETSNTVDIASGDTLTLASSSTTVEVNGTSYTVYLDGFLVNGVVVNTVTTPEEATVSYSVAAHVELTDSSSAEEYVLTGTLNTDAGADGLDSVVASNTSDDNGTLVVNENGSYSFTPSDALVSALGDTGSQVVEYSYSVVDGDGDSVENTLSITVSGPDADTGATTTVSGLSGSFYNYDDSTDGNLTTIAQAESIIANQSANATFISTNVDYEQAYNNLGSGSNLDSWLGSDSSSLTYVDQKSTEDSVVKLTGSVSLAAGAYSIKVSADDGYQIKINGESVAAVDHIQAVATDTFTFTVTESGELPIEIVYWDQGGAYQLSVSLAKEVGGLLGEYQVLGSDAYPTTAVVTDVSDIITDTTDDVVGGDDGSDTGTDASSGTSTSGSWSSEEELKAAHTDEVNQYGKNIRGGENTEATNGIDLNDPNTIKGTESNDTIRSGNKNDVVDGLDGNDLIEGQSGDDTLYGGKGNDKVLGGSDSDTLYGDAGDDWLQGESSDDTLHGGEGNDYLDGGSQNDTLYGDSGDDLLVGQSGNDNLYGGEGNDYLDAGYQNDYLDGGAGDDVLYGGGDNDTLIGGSGNDYLDSGDGVDKVDGGEGNDYLVGGGGVDTLTGGEGSDIFALNYEWSATDVLTDFNAEEDVLDVSDLLNVPDGEDDIQAYLDQNLSITSESVTAVINNNENDSKTVATFGDESNVTSGDAVSVIYNDTEYTINVDG